MKYMCMECQRIYKTRLEALDCCRPRVQSIEDDRVRPCERGGPSCEDDECPDCQGTGLMLIEQA